MEMTNYIVRIPTRFFLGAPSVLGNTFDDPKRAETVARASTTATRNVSTRMDDRLWVNNHYVAIAASCEAEALRIAKTDERYIKLRKEAVPVYVGDDADD